MGLLVEAHSAVTAASNFEPLSLVLTARERRGRRAHWSRCFFILLLLSIGGVATAQDTAESTSKAEGKKHVLVVSGARHDIPAMRGIEQGMREGLGTQMSRIELL